MISFKSNDAIEIVLIMLFKELDYNNVFAREHWLCAVASMEHPDLRQVTVALFCLEFAVDVSSSVEGLGTTRMALLTGQS